MTAYEFILKMKNYASSELQKVSKELGGVGTKADTASGKLGGMGKAGISLTGIFKGLISTLGMVGIGLGFFQIISMLNQGIEKAHLFHQAEAQVRAGLESTRGAAGLMYEDVEKSAKKLSSSVLYSKTDILGMQSILLTFPSITKKSFDPTSQIIMDMSTRLGQDLKSSAIQVGKALQDPERGITALRRVGVNFNDTQTETIKKLIATGQTAKAQALILAELNTEFGGSSKAAFDADPLAKYNKVVGSMKMQLGEAAIQIQAALAPALMGVAKAFQWLFMLVPPFIAWLIRFGNWITANKPLLIGLGLVLVGIGFNFLIANAGTIAWSIGLGILNGVIWLVTAAQTALNFVMAMNPISLVIIAIGALIAIVALLWDKFGWLRGSILGVWEVIKGLGTMIKNYVINRFKELLSGVQGIGQALVAFFNGDFKKAWEIGKKSVGDLMGVGSKEKLIKDGANAFKSFNKGWAEGNKEVVTPKKAAVKTKAAAISPLNNLYNEMGGAEDTTGKGAADKKQKSDSIVSGGSKQTQINITIGKLQDKTEIHVSNTDAGISDLGTKVQEALLRAVNSVNQMQTS